MIFKGKLKKWVKSMKKDEKIPGWGWGADSKQLKNIYLGYISTDRFSVQSKLYTVPLQNRKYF